MYDYLSGNEKRNFGLQLRNKPETFCPSCSCAYDGIIQSYLRAVPAPFGDVSDQNINTQRDSDIDSGNRSSSALQFMRSRNHSPAMGSSLLYTRQPMGINTLGKLMKIEINPLLPEDLRLALWSSHHRYYRDRSGCRFIATTTHHRDPSMLKHYYARSNESSQSSAVMQIASHSLPSHSCKRSASHLIADNLDEDIDNVDVSMLFLASSYCS